jgi:PIN domain nuclease of toxin-antitoxin system
MRYLLDTYTFLWFANQNAQLPSHIKDLISDPDRDVGISIASFWEIAIKNSIGKLALTSTVFSLEASAKDQDFEIVPVSIVAINHLTQMAHHHKDPFGRIIAATALTTGQALLSADPIFDTYGVSRMW